VFIFHPKARKACVRSCVRERNSSLKRKHSEWCNLSLQMLLHLLSLPLSSFNVQEYLMPACLAYSRIGGETPPLSWNYVSMKPPNCLPLHAIITSNGMGTICWCLSMNLQQTSFITHLPSLTNRQWHPTPAA